MNVRAYLFLLLKSTTNLNKDHLGEDVDNLQLTTMELEEELTGRLDEHLHLI